MKLGKGFGVGFWQMLLYIIIFSVVLVAACKVSILIYLLNQQSRKRLVNSNNPKEILPPQRSLFEPTDAEMRALETEQKAARRETLRQEIRAEAEANDFAALVESLGFEAAFYDEILSKLAANAETDEEFLLLAAFLSKNNLRTNGEIVRRFEGVWQKSFDKKDTIRLLHLAAKSERAEVFSETLENVLERRREGFLNEMSLEELKNLAESEFWILPIDARTSGAGFLLKQKLSNLNRDF